jgi:hypothetical protein
VFDYFLAIRERIVSKNLPVLFPHDSIHAYLPKFGIYWFSSSSRRIPRNTGFVPYLPESRIFTLPNDSVPKSASLVLLNPFFDMSQ